MFWCVFKCNNCTIIQTPSPMSVNSTVSTLYCGLIYLHYHQDLITKKNPQIHTLEGNQSRFNIENVNVYKNIIYVFNLIYKWYEYLFWNCLLLIWPSSKYVLLTGTKLYFLHKNLVLSRWRLTVIYEKTGGRTSHQLFIAKAI